MKQPDTQHTIKYIYAISIVANLLIFLFVFSQTSRINSLADYWLTNSETDLKRATELAQAERALGYVGFIHHFKNYVLRKEERYYLLARTAFENAQGSIAQLETLTVSDSDKRHLAQIRATMLEYNDKLNLARQQVKQLPTEQLDELVKVDDTDAERALNALRAAILPRLDKQQAFIDSEIRALKQGTVSLVFVLVPFFILSTMFTISLLRRFIGSVDEVSLIFDMTPDGIIYTNSNGDILRVNQSACDMFCYSKKEMMALTIEDLLLEKDRANHKQTRHSFTAREQSRLMGDRENNIQARRKDGSAFSVIISIASKTVNNENMALCVIKDITVTNILETESQTDPLTLVHNRRYFDRVLKKELIRNERNDQQLSLLMVDLDDFKQLNDEEGHIVGDMALKELANFLVDNSREYDIVARWGGDEFILLCPGLSQDRAMIRAERIKSKFQALQFPWQSTLTLSIGIATANIKKPYSASSMINAGDKAVYFAKDSGRNRVIHANDLEES